jgi:hypothetical protein
MTSKWCGWLNVNVKWTYTLNSPFVAFKCIKEVQCVSNDTRSK